jgi:hypothetical protein
MLPKNMHRKQVSIPLLADTMTGAIPSTMPLGVLIVTFCQPLKDIEFPIGILSYFGLL